MASQTVKSEENTQVKTESLNKVKTNKFIGQIENGCPYTGHGKWTYPNGDEFTGSWLNGKWETGDGKFLLPNGDYTHGTWLNCKWLTRNEIVTRNGCEFRGIWPNGDHFTGDYEWHTGTGKKSFPNGDNFVGSWLDGKLQTGNGKLTQPNGDHFVGNWLDGEQQTGILYTACKLENGKRVKDGHDVASCKKLKVETE